MVQDDRAGFARGRPQRPADLLQKQPKALCRPQQYCGADRGDVDAFRDQTAICEDIELAGTERSYHPLALVPRCLAVDVRGFDAGFPESLGDLLVMTSLDPERHPRHADTSLTYVL